MPDMLIVELERERKKLIQAFNDEKQLLWITYKAKLDAITSQIKGQRHRFADSKGKKVKSILSKIKKI